MKAAAVFLHPSCGLFVILVAVLVGGLLVVSYRRLKEWAESWALWFGDEGEDASDKVQEGTRPTPGEYAAGFLVLLFYLPKFILRRWAEGGGDSLTDDRDS